MNTIIQNIFVLAAVLFAVGFLFKKFFWQKKAKKSCGSDGCGCH
jgi:hypothetical protein